VRRVLKKAGGDDRRRNGFDTNYETHSVLVAWLGRCPRSERLIGNSLVGNLEKEQWQIKKKLKESFEHTI
jgi:hypothetical protein